MAKHLIVLVHGLAGSPEELHYMYETLEKDAKEITGGVRIHKAQCNNYAMHTVDGVLSGGLRLADEIEAISKDMPGLKGLSIIAHSVGGLYSRYAIGILNLRNYFRSVKPINFVTLATPHLGIRRSGSAGGVWQTLFHAVAKTSTGRTGMHLILSDSDGAMVPLPGTRAKQPTALPIGGINGDPEAPLLPPSQAAVDPDAQTMDEVEDERTYAAAMDSDHDPILAVLCRPDSVYFQALALYRHRAAYANVVGDMEVPFSTSAVIPCNPFKRGKVTWTSLSCLDEQYPHIVAEMDDGVNWTISGDQIVPQKWPNVPYESESDEIRSHLSAMLTSLTSITWRRVAVRFTTIGGLADPLCHTHIIMARKWLNSVGSDVVHDVVRHMDWSL